MRVGDFPALCCPLGQVKDLGNLLPAIGGLVVSADVMLVGPSISTLDRYYRAAPVAAAEPTCSPQTPTGAATLCPERLLLQY